MADQAPEVLAERLRSLAQSSRQGCARDAPSPALPTLGAANVGPPEDWALKTFRWADFRPFESR